MDSLVKHPRMHHPNIPINFGAVLRGAGLSFFLFTSVLAGLLIFSWTMLIPMLTRVNVGGTVRTTRELLQYKKELTTNIALLEKKRHDFVHPMQGTVFASLTERKRSHVFLPYQDEVERIAEHIVPDQPDAVLFQSIRYSANDHTLELTGDVRHIGPRSMTVLAQFVEELRALPFVASMERPQFVREEDPLLGFHSPFVITLTIVP